MATLFLDEFNGGGALVDHISDSGHGWSITSQSPVGTPQLSGAGTLITASTIDGFARFAANSQMVLAAPAATVTLEFDWYFTPGLYGGFVSVGIISSAGPYEFSIQKFVEEGDLVYIGGEVGYISVPGIVNGRNVISIAVNFETGLSALEVNGNQFYLGAGYQSIGSPFGAYVAFSGGDNSSFPPPYSTAVFHRLTVTDGAPTPPVTGEFWTNIIRAVEQS